MRLLALPILLCVACTSARSTQTTPAASAVKDAKVSTEPTSAPEDTAQKEAQKALVVEMVQKIDAMVKSEIQFAEPCLEEQAISIGLTKDDEGRVRMYQSTQGTDVWRTDTQYYDEADTLRFNRSTMVNSTTEGKRTVEEFWGKDGNGLGSKMSTREVASNGLGLGLPPEGEWVHARHLKAVDGQADHERLKGTCTP